MEPAKGLAPRLHAEQLTRTGAAQLAVKLGAASCDHLEQVNRADITALSKSKTVATLLPGCDFHLGLKQYAPARPLIEAGAIVALATDYNPGTSPTLSMAAKVRWNSSDRCRCSRTQRDTTFLSSRSEGSAVGKGRAFAELPSSCGLLFRIRRTRRSSRIAVPPT